MAREHNAVEQRIVKRQLRRRWLAPRWRRGRRAFSWLEVVRLLRMRLRLLCGGPHERRWFDAPCCGACRGDPGNLPLGRHQRRHVGRERRLRPAVRQAPMQQWARGLLVACRSSDEGRWGDERSADDRRGADNRGNGGGRLVGDGGRALLAGSCGEEGRPCGQPRRQQRGQPRG